MHHAHRYVQMRTAFVHQPKDSPEIVRVCVYLILLVPSSGFVRVCTYVSDWNEQTCVLVRSTLGREVPVKRCWQLAGRTSTSIAASLLHHFSPVIGWFWNRLFGYLWYKSRLAYLPNSIKFQCVILGQGVVFWLRGDPRRGDTVGSREVHLQAAALDFHLREFQASASATRQLA